MKAMRTWFVAAAVCSSAALVGCATQPSQRFMPAAGPSTGAMVQVPDGVGLINLDMSKARELAQKTVWGSFDSLPAPAAFTDRIAVGERIEITLMEASPAMLLAGSPEPGLGARSLQVPSQVVQMDGTITVPFVGTIVVVNKTAQQVQREIVQALQGKANAPQALVRVEAGAQEVTIVGEVRSARRMALTQKGERLLDAIAAAGGSSAPVEKVSVALTRNGVSAEMPLEHIIKNPRNNVRLAAGDVVTLYHQPRHFVALGAVTKQGEVPFEATGITLSQAVGRVGGLNDNRSNPAGVFLARKEGEEAIVYHVDMSRPDALFIMRSVPIRDGDIVYVANAGAAELQKFLQVVGAIFNPLATINSLSN